jgi:predicted PurR-regulated permease PerM
LGKRVLGAIAIIILIIVLIKKLINNMSSETITKVTKMMESLPDSLQQQVVDHLREYIATLQEEKEWDNLVNKTQTKLIDFARKAKEEIALGKATPFSQVTVPNDKNIAKGTLKSII